MKRVIASARGGIGVVVDVPDLMPAELAALTAELERQEARRALAETDKEMARVGEDLVDILIVKGLITMDDFPEAARAKIADRKAKRAAL